MTAHILRLAFLMLILRSDFVRGAALYEAFLMPQDLEFSLGLPLVFSANNISAPGSDGAPEIGNYSKIPPSRGHSQRHPSKTRPLPRSDPSDLRPTPAPTGNPSPSTTSPSAPTNATYDFEDPVRRINADAENDGITFCSFNSQTPTCTQRLQDGFVRAAAVTHSDDGAFVQVFPPYRLDDYYFEASLPSQITGCIDPSKSLLDPSDDGGQFDVRFPNGAQCAFGGYAASFIEQ
ncbi:hypothetical protein NLI96_g10022 [Meripilus lineatus]|uniref:Uncharacterized protein n=1 Tax=Meripilus lineatus TaxID=2056292 RepID=A0AAD5UUP5_9APHY|nr:hypothetical protein NLI96_g10022 [Physisporinus lineatus]